MEARFHVDGAQADRVEATALAFLRQVRADWKLDEPLAELALRWAARLHEVGLDIAHSHYHKHGAYLLANCRPDTKRCMMVSMGAVRGKGLTL